MRRPGLTPGTKSLGAAGPNLRGSRFVSLLVFESRWVLVFVGNFSFRGEAVCWCGGSYDFQMMIGKCFLVITSDVPRQCAGAKQSSKRFYFAVFIKNFHQSSASLKSYSC